MACQAITWTNSDVKSVGLWGTNFSKICIKIQFSLWKKHLKMMSGKYAPFRFGLNALKYRFDRCVPHYDDVIMRAIASQSTSLTIVYSTVYSGADQRKHESSASLAFVWGIHRDRWIPRTKGQLRGKCFHLMTSSWGKLVPFSICIWATFITGWNLTYKYR